MIDTNKFCIVYQDGDLELHYLQQSEDEYGEIVISIDEGVTLEDILKEVNKFIGENLT